MPASGTNQEKPIDNLYHVFNSGVENIKIFSDNEDFQVFLSFLKEYLSPPLDLEQLKTTFSVKGRVFKGVPHLPKNFFNKAEIIAYNLSPNHFHLIVSEKSAGSLERLIRSLCTRYAIYYNKRYQRRGSLFVGPYKSVKLENAYQLLYLTRFLHRKSLENTRDKTLIQNVYSSYPEFLGSRKTSWVKPTIVLSQLENVISNNASGITNYDILPALKGEVSLRRMTYQSSIHLRPEGRGFLERCYKNFVENYELNEQEEKITENIILEQKASQPQSDQKTDEVYPKSVLIPDQNSASVVPEPRSKMPEFVAVSVTVFILLFALGLRNINTSMAKTKNALITMPQPTPEVAGTETVNSVDTSPSPLPSPLPTSQILPTEEPKALQTEYSLNDPETPVENTSEPVSKNFIAITISDGSKNINVRSGPSILSEKIGTADDGEIFEFISLNAGWYKIKLEDNTIAYISQRYAKEITEGGNR